MNCTHVEGPTQRTLARAMTGAGLALFGIAIQHPILDFGATRGAAAVSQLGATIAAFGFQGQLGVPKLAESLELRGRNVRYRFAAGEVEREELALEWARKRPTRDQVTWTHAVLARGIPKDELNKR